MTTTDWQPTACILCECNCGIVVQVEDRTLARIRGDKAHPGSQGYTCNKALRLDHYQNNGNRLTSPMRRRSDGSYEEIDWDTAISEIAEGFAVSKPTISHHLDLLRQAGLILSEKDGQFVIYSLNTSVLEECFVWLLKMTKKRKEKSYETAEKRMAATPDPDHALLRRRPAVG